MREWNDDGDGDGGDNEEDSTATRKGLQGTRSRCDGVNILCVTFAIVCLVSRRRAGFSVRNDNLCE